MPSYLELRDNIESGDTISCKRRAWFSVLIRVFTAESDNHTAVLLRDPQGGVWVTEMREGKQGFQIKPAFQWIFQEELRGTEMTLCKAPLNTDATLMRQKILKTREQNPDYGYITLMLVELSQMLNVRFQGLLPVCSTYAQAVHEAGGYTGYKKLCDPGDIRQHSPVRWALNAP